MKTITFLTLLLVLPMFAVGQTFDFNATDDGFSESGSCTLSTNPTFLSVNLTGDGTNPAFGTTTAGVNATANAFVGVTIKNSDPAGPTLMRVSFPKTPSGRVYVNLDITNGDTDYKTYWFDLTNSNWTGTVDDIKIHFKNSGNTDYTVPTAGVTVDVDKIQFTSAIPRVEKTIYEFNTDDDSEGWAENSSTISVAGGNLTMTPDVGSAAKIVQNDYSVNADVNSHMHIVYKNLSADNNQLRIQFKSPHNGYGAYIGTNVTIDQNMSDFATVSLDLATLKPDDWIGYTQDFQVTIRNSNNADNVASAGDLVIDRIIFNKEPSLSVANNEFASLLLYPNPTNDVLYIKGVQNIKTIEVFDINGRAILKSESSLNSINVSALSSGTYLVKIANDANNFVVKKLVIK